MSLYLNNTKYGSSNQSSQDTLIHSYNKSLFSDYEHAKSVLLLKTMNAGEVTFAYYYDAKTPYGLNAIFAVGPLNDSGCNIIFKNADEIDSVKDSLDETIADINASVSSMETKVDGIIDECRTPLLEKIRQNSDDIKNIKKDITNIKYDIDDKNDTLTSNINQVNEQLTAKITKEKDILNNNIKDTSILIWNYVDDISRGIINYIDRTSSAAVSSITIDYTLKNSDTSMTLGNAISTLKLNLESSISNLSEKHDREIGSLTTLINESKNKISENSTKLSTYIQNNDNQLIKLNTSINKVNEDLTESLNEHKASFDALKIPEKIALFTEQIETVTTKSNIDHEKLKKIDNIDTRLTICEDWYQKHFSKDMVNLNGNIEDINTSISNIIKNIESLEIKTGTSEGTVLNEFDKISEQLSNISERLSKIDSSINMIETKVSSNETSHDELLFELNSYKNSLDY